MEFNLIVKISNNTEQPTNLQGILSHTSYLMCVLT